MNEPNAGREARFRKELSLLLRVPYPLVFVRTFEERAHLELLAELADQSSRKLKTWTGLEAQPDTGQTIDDGWPLSGAPHPPTEQQRHAFAGPHSLGTVLNDFQSEDKSAILVLLEPGDALSDRLVVRTLHELIPLLEAREQSIVVLGAAVQPPESLVRHATRLDGPLPDRDILASLLANTLKDERYPLLPRERIVAASLGLAREQALRAWKRAALAYSDQGEPVLFDWEGEVLSEKRRAISAESVAEFVDNDEDLSSVGGLDDLKTWLATREAAYTQEARDFGLPSPRGLLLVGVQGCGKSLLAKAVARHWRLPLLRLDLGAIFAGVYAPDAALHRALKVAEAMAPSVLWTDEIEKGFAADGSGTTRRVLGSLLTWLQEKDSEVFFVATANDVAGLPPELLRKGRFDEMFFVDLPDQTAREQILEIHIEKRGRDPAHFALSELAEQTENFSGAELEQVVVGGLYEAFAEGRELATVDLQAVIKETVPLYATRQDDIKRLREWAASRARFAARNRRLVDFFNAE